MKKLIIVGIIFCLFSLNGCGKTVSTSSTAEPTTEKAEASEKATQEIVDMAGRTVTIPNTIKSVFGVNNNASIFLYTLAPELMIGWNSSLSEKSEKYIEPKAYNLPVLGSFYGNSEKVNLESIIAKEPDIIVFLQANMNEKIIQAADELQDKLSIPVVMVDGDFEKYDEAYEFMGKILKCEEKASVLAAYCKETYELAADVKEKYASDVPVTVYYEGGEDGLLTTAKGSSQSATIDMLGAFNVVDDKTINSENATISLEELISLNPNYIILGNSGFSSGDVCENLALTEGWNTLTAVSEGKVYSIPNLPFNWFDKPPSVNRILGIHWLISVLYPDFEGEGIVSECKEYFNLFYHVEIKDEQINKMIGKG
ncbi:MAG TPA: hypothetical protein DIC60_10900 [Lachnospiraceae bacterium]|nr:hypothetical protein [Lachnospiraceae bacterium]